MREERCNRRFVVGLQRTVWETSAIEPVPLNGTMNSLGSNILSKPKFVDEDIG